MISAYDVVVVGGGTAGICAAVEAGRAGCRTLLVEKTGQLGGTMTSASVPLPASFHAWGKQVIAGIGWELVSSAMAAGGTAPGDPGQGCPVPLRVNQALFAALADEMVLSAGVEILLHVMPARAQFDGKIWQIDLCTKTGLRSIAARTVVDCTGDANMVTMAGLAVERGSTLQPATLVVNVDGYDAAALDYESLQKAFEQAVAAGEVRSTDCGWNRGQIRLFLQLHGGNRNHVPGVDGSTSEGRTLAEIESRRAMMRLYRWCRRQKGLEKMQIHFMAPETGIRESVIIVGKQKVTEADYLAGRVWDDSICYSLYPIDVHCDEWVDYVPIQNGVFPTIPLGALLPRDGRSIIVAGRCIAGDRRSNSSYRVQAPCMAMGQAAGAAAALAARLNIEVQDVPFAQLRAMLEANGAIVPGRTPTP